VSLFIYEVSPVAKNGEIDINVVQTGGNGNPHIYEVKYVPDPGFVGIDTFILQFTYINNYPFLSYQAYRVFVYPALLNARPDYAVTPAGIPVTIDVLANDQGSNGPFEVSFLPLVNNGTAAVDAFNRVVFTPTPGFTGIAHANYVVCDASAHCQTSEISIGIHDNAVSDDSLRIATAKNTPVTIPLPRSGYTLFQAPAHGMVSLESGRVFKYTPSPNFTGTDPFVLVTQVNGDPVYKLWLPQ
jgi:hypothetical protein